MTRPAWSAAAAAVLLALYAAAPGAVAQEGAFAFEDVTVISMDRDGPLPGQTVVVVGGVITEVGPAGTVAVPQGAQRIDGTGRYLMPGLAEMHAHVPPSANPPREALEDIFFLYIANGITTIRGMLGSPYQVPLADELESGELLGPTLYVGAPSLNGNSAPTPQDAQRLVREHSAADYDLLKIHPGVSMEAWNAMTAVAAEVGITFGGHVPADVGLERAMTSGMSTVDHLDGYVQAVASPDVVSQINTGQPISLGELVAGVDEDRIAEIVQLTIDEDVYVVPTMYLWENLYGTSDPEPFLELPEMQYVSQAQRDAWRRQAAGGPRGTPEALEAFFSLRKRILKELADAGAGILMGTDSPQMFNVPGFALHREIRLMSEAGMTNRQILESGTSAVARYVESHLSLDGNFGAVAPGNRADLVLLGSNPLDGMDNLTDRVGVMVRGRWMSRAEIDEGLARLAAKHRGISN